MLCHRLGAVLYVCSRAIPKSRPRENTTKQAGKKKNRGFQTANPTRKCSFLYRRSPVLLCGDDEFLSPMSQIPQSKKSLSCHYFRCSKTGTYRIDISHVITYPWSILNTFSQKSIRVSLPRPQTLACKFSFLSGYPLASNAQINDRNCQLHHVPQGRARVTPRTLFPCWLG